MASPSDKNPDKKTPKKTDTAKQKKDKPASDKSSKVRSVAPQTPGGQTSDTQNPQTPTPTSRVKTVSPSPPTTRSRSSVKTASVGRDVTQTPKSTKRAPSKFKSSGPLALRHNLTNPGPSQVTTRSSGGSLNVDFSANTARYNPRLGPNGQLAPAAYSAQTIMELTKSLALQCGMDKAIVIKHPYQIIDWILGQGSDRDIAVNISSLAQILESQFQRAELLAEYADAGLRNHSTFLRIWQNHAEVRQAIDPISRRVQTAKKARSRMEDNMTVLTRYMGDAYFKYHFLEFMTPTLSDAMRNALKYIYGHNIAMSELHTRLDKARRDRLLIKQKGVSSKIDLLPSDVEKVLRDDFDKAAVSNKDIKAINSRLRPTGNSDQYIKLDATGRLQPHSTAIPAYKSVTIQGDETIYSGKGRLQSRESVQKQIDMAIQRIITKKDSSSVSVSKTKPSMDSTPRRSSRSKSHVTYPTTKDTVMTGTKQEPSQTTGDALKVGTTTSGQKLWHTDMDLEKTPPVDTAVDKAALKIVGQTPGSEGLLDFKRGQREVADLGIRPLDHSWDDIFAKIPTGHMPPPPISLSSTPGNTSQYLVEHASKLENDLVKWVVDGARHMSGLLKQPGKVSADLQNAIHGDVLEAVSRISKAVASGKPKDKAHPVMTHSEWPWLEFIAIHTMARTLQLVEARRDPAWISYARSLTQEMLSNFIGIEDMPIQIGTTFHNQRINLSPNELREDAFFHDEAHPGRYMGWLDDQIVLAAVLFLTRHDQQAQHIDPVTFAAWTQQLRAARAAPDTAPAPFQLRVYDLNTQPVIYLPLHVRNNHWLLVILDTQTRRFEILNSINTNDYDQAAVDAVTDIITEVLGDNMDQWQRGDLQSTQQANSADCGFWVAANAAAYASRREVAGRQTTQDLRLWLLRLLCSALSHAATGNLAAFVSRERWANESQQPDIVNLQHVQKPSRVLRQAGPMTSMLDIEEASPGESDLSPALSSEDLNDLLKTKVDDITATTLNTATKRKKSEGSESESPAQKKVKKSDA